MTVTFACFLLGKSAGCQMVILTRGSKSYTNKFEGDYSTN